MPGSTYNDFIAGRRAALNPAPATPSTLQSTTTANNLATAPDLTSLTNLVNSLNQNAQTSANAARVPGNPALEQQSSQNISSELSGQLPPDVLNLINQQAAERGIATGSPGSDNNNAAMLRALGLTSLQQQQAGQANLSAADARNPVAPIFDPTSQFLTPAQQGQITNQGNMTTLDWLNSILGGGLNRPASLPSSLTGRGALPTDTSTGTTAPVDNSWWNSLFSGGTPTASATSPGSYPTSTSTASSTDPSNPSYWDFNNPQNWAGSDLPDPAGTAFDINTSADPFNLYGINAG